MDKPEQSAKDVAHKLTKGVIGAIPFAGAFIGELMEIVIQPQYQKKLDEWFVYVDSTINELVANQSKTKDEIFSDEEFISMFLRTSEAYINNVEKNKIPFLQACLKSSITKNVELNKRLIFLDILDKLTEKHLLILNEIYENQNSDNSKYQDELTEYLTSKYANGESEYYGLLQKGLRDFRLLVSGSADIVKEGKNQWHICVSEIGREVIEFLTDKEVE